MLPVLKWNLKLNIYLQTKNLVDLYAFYLKENSREMAASVTLPVLVEWNKFNI